MKVTTNSGKPLRQGAEEWDALDTEAYFDVVVIGGGIHGAAVARLCAMNGLSTALFERHDYAAGTSSRSSKMVHGGLRYLEMFDFEQVFEGIKAREGLFVTAQHIVRPERFYIPVYDRPRLMAWKMRIGLTLYDLFVRDRSRAHRWIPRSFLESTSFRSDTAHLKGCFEYCDGLMDDTRLVIDNIVSARLHGAVCLNYAEVVSIDGDEGKKLVHVRYVLSGAHKTITTKLVMNCSGPWVCDIQGVSKNETTPSVRYSQGTHLLFSKQWTDNSLFLQLEEKGRYYFVWPHPEGTLVGTTEREVTEPAVDPQPTPEEIEEILARLHRDLPHAGLDRSTLSYCFAGIRTLPSRGGSATKTSKLSRKHIWEYGDGVLSLFGGKYTTAYWTAFEGMKKAWELLRLPGTPRSLAGVPLEATALLHELAPFQTAARARGVSEYVIEQTARRLGGNVRYLMQEDGMLEPIADSALRGEIEWAFRVEQATCLQDVMRRRVGIELRPDHGFPAIDEICAIGSRYLPNHDFCRDVAEYKAALEDLHKLMGIGPFADTGKQTIT